MKSLIKNLTKVSKDFIKNHVEIKDIILFGSLLRGKEKPNDVDILLIFKKRIDKDIEYNLKNSFKKFSLIISIISKTEKECFDPSFDVRESILFEGYSLLKSKFVSKDFGFASLGLFIYNTKFLTNTQKTKFYYAFNGRGKNKGLIRQWDAIKLSDNIITTPLNKIEQAKEFFEYWKISYKYIPFLIPERMNKPHIIGKLNI